MDTELSEVERLAVEWVNARERLARYKTETPRHVMINSGGVDFETGIYEPGYPTRAYQSEINKLSAATRKLIKAAKTLRG